MLSYFTIIESRFSVKLYSAIYYAISCLNYKFCNSKSNPLDLTVPAFFIVVVVGLEHPRIESRKININMKDKFFFIITSFLY